MVNIEDRDRRLAIMKSVKVRQCRSTLTFDARMLGQVVDNGLAGVYMIINEGDAFFESTSTKNRDSSQAMPCRPQDFLRSVRPELSLFL